MRILIVPDSFKGSLTAQEVCRCIDAGLHQAAPECVTELLPLADGGEGFTECMLNICKGNKLYTETTDIYGRRCKAAIGVVGGSAVIDCAAASGLQKRKDVMRASSYGTGDLIKFAVSQGFRDIILGLGGTGCCDGGAGALVALGAKLYDENYRPISRPCGNDLNSIFGAGFRDIVKDIHFTFACDVDNEYYGSNGAAAVFAPQKGATPAQVRTLDEGLKRLNAFLPRDIAQVKGAGAAGGICGGLYAVYQGDIRSGFEILAEYAALEQWISACDLVVTGEGKTDRQTLMGKLPYRVAQLAAKHGKQCVVLSGTVEEVRFGDRMLSLTDEKTDAATAMAHAAEILTEKSKCILQNAENTI